MNSYETKELNEKECPYCGGGIEFSIQDKIIKCPYCGKDIDVTKFNPETIIKTEKKYYDVKGKTRLTIQGGEVDKRSIVKIIIIVIVILAVLIFGAISFIKNQEFKSRYEEISSKNIDYGFLEELHEKSKKKIKDEAKNLSSYSISSISHYKTLVYNTKHINDQGYNNENSIYDINKVQYSDGLNSIEVYQCVKYNHIKVKDSVVYYDEDDPTYAFRDYSIGTLEKGTFNELKVTFNKEESVYGSTEYDKLYSYLMDPKNWDKWNFNSILEIDE